MTELKIYVAAHTDELCQAIQALNQASFQQTSDFTTLADPSVTRKDLGSMGNVLWQTITFIATVEGTLQFADRVKLMERVKKILTLCKRDKTTVLVQIANEKPVEITDKSADEVVDLLTKQTDDKHPK
jgi:hypothetical protein